MNEPPRLDLRSIRVVLWLTASLLLGYAVLLFGVFRHVEEHLAQSNEVLQTFGRTMGAQLEAFAAFAKYTTDGTWVDGEPEGSPVLGAHGAALVTVVEFSDLLCPACRRIADSLLPFVRAHSPDVRLVYKHYPLTALRPEAFGAALAGVCAAKEDKFWEFSNAAFSAQSAIEAQGTGLLADVGEGVGLDSSRLVSCMASPEARKLVERDLELGGSLVILDTPTLFVNGKRIGSANWRLLRSAIEWEIRKAQRAKRTDARLSRVKAE